MKLLIAITVAEYREQLQQFFSEQQVSFYNEIPMQGVKKLDKAPHRLGNWFGQKNSAIDNIAFLSFIDDNQADGLLEALSHCKNKMPRCNIEAYVMNVEKGV
ncbi:MAG: hypothetical protein N4A59_10930 [Marinifilum sp.]|jgi:hypothetical protein|nr:hypothetical protein [Marinifilum sp.]